LLRVLQEQEFERLGGTKAIRVNVRLVAATHRDLERMVAEGQFRGALYYRLKVFPLVLPLRERRADIPQLVRHFTNRFARRMGRRIDVFPAEVMDALVHYPWPGNIRELENLIERAVILSPGPTLQISLGELKLPAVSAEALPDDPVTLAEVEREHVLSVLRATNWVVGGPNGAAVRLGLTRSTFYRMMKKLSISRIA
jgi:formate hydrogenlyase transcriptional activator